MTAPLVRPPHVLAEIPMSTTAAAHITADNADQVVKAYFEPQTTSPKPGGDASWHIYGDVALTVTPTGFVCGIGSRERPDDQRVSPPPGGLSRPKLVPLDDPVPAGFGRTRNGGRGRRSGHRGGSTHPTTVGELLARCRAAGLHVEPLAKGGGHYKISRPADWARPPQATSGCVFVSSTNEVRATRKNTNIILRETGVDVRSSIADLEAEYWARCEGESTMTVTAEISTPASDAAPEPTGTEEAVAGAGRQRAEIAGAGTQASERTGAAPGGRRPHWNQPPKVTRGRAGAEEIADRLVFVASMREEGHSDGDIAVAMDVSPNWLSAFLSMQRTQGHPLAVPPRKRYTEPTTGVVTRPGVIRRTVRKARPPVRTATAKAVTAKAAGKPSTERPDSHPVVAPTSDELARQTQAALLSNLTTKISPGELAQQACEASRQAGEEFLARLKADTEAQAQFAQVVDQVITEGAAAIAAMVAEMPEPEPEPEPEFPPPVPPCGPQPAEPGPIAPETGYGPYSANQGVPRGWSTPELPTTADLMPTATAVLAAALARVGVADPERVARHLRFELVDSGWRLRIEASL